MPQKRPTESPELRLRRLLDESAPVSFKKLVSNGCVEHDLVQLLLVIPRAPTQKVPLVTGMSFQDLAKLSVQIVDVAEKLERVNASWFLGPSTFASLAELHQGLKHDFPFPLNILYTKGADGVFSEMFKLLPARLRLYAEYLQKGLPGWKKFDRISRHGFRPQTLAILKLLKLVKDSTGSYYYEDVAILLQAAFCDAGVNRFFDAEALRKLRKNNPFLEVLLHPELLG